MSDIVHSTLLDGELFTMCEHLAVRSESSSSITVYCCYGCKTLTCVECWPDHVRVCDKVAEFWKKTLCV